MSNRNAVYAGSFDPITLGHMSVIERAAKLFDNLWIIVANNPDKNYMLTLEERKGLVEEAVRESRSSLDHVTIIEGGNVFTVQHAKALGAQYMVRGIRTASDLEYETTLKEVNHDIEPTIETICVFPSRLLSAVSSGLVRGMIGFEEWESQIGTYLPDNVFRYLVRKYSKDAEKYQV